MTDQLDFGVNWVKDFSVRRASVFMDTFFIHSYAPSLATGSLLTVFCCRSHGPFI